MDSDFIIIKQDFEVAKKAFERNDFRLASIIGNRIMTNLFIVNKI